MTEVDAELARQAQEAAPETQTDGGGGLMSAISVEFEDVLLGKPDQLDPRAADLVTAAAAIEKATASLRGLIEGRPPSTEALAETASEVARSLSRARTRYRNTGQALQTYAADLRPIQQDARAAIATAEYYEQKSATIPNDISRREGDLLRAEAVEAPQPQIDEIEADCAGCGRRSRTRPPRQDARQQLSSARERLRAIADAAISQIETAIEGDSDSAYDNWNQFWDGAAGGSASGRRTCSRASSKSSGSCSRSSSPSSSSSSSSSS
jgi:F0F1-type ATP synthase membrane subunit b/b'